MLYEFAAVGHGFVDGGEDDVAIFVGHAGYEELRHEVGDLLLGEVDNADDLPAGQLLLSVMLCYLCARPFDAVRAEVDLEFVGGFAGLREVGHLKDGAGAELDLFKIMPGDGLHNHKGKKPPLNLPR